MSKHDQHEETHEETHFRPQLGGGAAAEPPPPGVPMPSSVSAAAAGEPAPAAKKSRDTMDPLNYRSADEYAAAMRERYPHIHAVAGWESAWHVAHARAAAQAEARSEFEAHAREHMAAIAKFPTLAPAPTGPKIKFCR